MAVSHIGFYITQQKCYIMVLFHDCSTINDESNRKWFCQFQNTAILVFLWRESLQALNLFCDKAFAKSTIIYCSSTGNPGISTPKVKYYTKKCHSFWPFLFQIQYLYSLAHRVSYVAGSFFAGYRSFWADFLFVLRSKAVEKLCQSPQLVLINAQNHE